MTSVLWSTRPSHGLAVSMSQSTTLPAKALPFIGSTSPSSRYPDRHAGFDPARIALRIEAQPERVAIVIADRALGLPGRESAERSQLGDHRRHRVARAGTRDLDRRPYQEVAQQDPARVDR